jgi:hypothetical protein
MRVFNVTPSTEVEYRGRMISPNGGFVDLPDVPFLPDRDLQLERDKIIAFRRLPEWFLLKKQMEEDASRLAMMAPVMVPTPAVDELAPEPAEAPKKLKR